MNQLSGQGIIIINLIKKTSFTSLYSGNPNLVKLKFFESIFLFITGITGYKKNIEIILFLDVKLINQKIFFR